MGVDHEAIVGLGFVATEESLFSAFRELFPGEEPFVNKDWTEWEDPVSDVEQYVPRLSAVCINSYADEDYEYFVYVRDGAKKVICGEVADFFIDIQQPRVPQELIDLAELCGKRLNFKIVCYSW